MKLTDMEARELADVIRKLSDRDQVRPGYAEIFWIVGPGGQLLQVRIRGE